MPVIITNRFVVNQTFVVFKFDVKFELSIENQGIRVSPFLIDP